jgi:hypothetical protein
MGKKYDLGSYTNSLCSQENKELEWPHMTRFMDVKPVTLSGRGRLQGWLDHTEQ